MTQPLIFVSTHTIKQGKLEEYRKKLTELVEVVESNEPRLIAFNIYADEATNQLTSVQVHPDAASMQFHLQVVSEHIKGSYADYIERTESMAVLGKAPAELVDGIRSAVPEGTPVQIVPAHEAGFTRSSAGR